MNCGMFLAVYISKISGSDLMCIHQSTPSFEYEHRSE